MKTQNNPQIIITGANDTFHLALWDQKGGLAGQVYMTRDELDAFIKDATNELINRVVQNNIDEYIGDQND